MDADTFFCSFISYDLEFYVEKRLIHWKELLNLLMKKAAMVF